MKKRELLGVLSLLFMLVISSFAMGANETNLTQNTLTNSTIGGTVSTPGALANNAQTVGTLTATSDSESVNKAYSCLTNLVKNKTSASFSLQEAFFSVMALGGKTNTLDKIESERNSNNCWPKTTCTLKDTSLALLAYKAAGKSTTNIENWLGTKNGTINGMSWFIEVDINNHNSSKCSVSYDGSAKKFQINEDMTLSGSAGSCFSLSSGGYWLKIKDNCLDKSFDISCDQDFITTLIYQKSGGDTVYVSPTTHSAASLGTTSEKVNAKCFKSGSVCDYEGSLWAAFALNKAGKDVSSYTPYLIAMAPDNTKFLPSAFNYVLTPSDEVYSDLTGSQKNGKYWEMTANSRYYDTALAMMALQGSSAGELVNAQNYLISIQTKEGCWNNNNIRDTAFLLYGGWPRGYSSSEGSSSSTLCSAVGRSCESSLSSCLAAGGTVDGSFICAGSLICCSVKVPLLTCSQMNGKICASNEECTGTTASSADGSCCRDSCVEVQQQDTCSPTGAICRSSCQSGEEAVNEICGQGLTCCMQSSSESGSSTWLWIVLLIILIILVAVAIIFRDKLRIWWFEFRGKAKSSPVTRPGAPPRPMASAGRPPFSPRAMPPRFGLPPQRAPPRAAPLRKPASEKDNELEETLKKLRDMSK